MRITELTPVQNGGITLTQELPLEDPSQTLKMTVGQFIDFIEMQVQEKLYPVNSIYISMKPENPSTYLGFGEWAPRSGSLAGTGPCSDSRGKSDSYGVGYQPGYWRMAQDQMIAFNPAWDMVSTVVGDHAHHLEFYTGVAGNHTHVIANMAATGDGGDGDDDGAIYWRQEGSNSTAAAGDHQHLVAGDTWGAGTHSHEVEGWISVGSGDGVTGSSFFNPYFGCYVWQRTA